MAGKKRKTNTASRDATPARRARKTLRPEPETVEIDSEEERLKEEPRLRGALRGLNPKNVLESIDLTNDDSESDKENSEPAEARDEKPHVTRHMTRGSRFGRSDANYDMNQELTCNGLHPMDVVTRPKRAAKRLSGGNSDSASISQLNDEETDEESLPSSAKDGESSEDDANGEGSEDDEALTERMPDPKASRHSQRVVKVINYSTKHHPNDDRIPGYQHKARQGKGVMARLSKTPDIQVPSKNKVSRKARDGIAEQSEGDDDMDNDEEPPAPPSSPPPPPRETLKSIEDVSSFSAISGLRKKEMSYAGGRLNSALASSDNAELVDLVEGAIRGSQAPSRSVHHSGESLDGSDNHGRSDGFSASNEHVRPETTIQRHPSLSNNNENEETTERQYNDEAVATWTAVNASNDSQQRGMVGAKSAPSVASPQRERPQSSGPDAEIIRQSSATGVGRQNSSSVLTGRKTSQSVDGSALVETNPQMSVMKSASQLSSAPTLAVEEERAGTSKSRTNSNRSTEEGLPISTEFEQHFEVTEKHGDRVVEEPENEPSSTTLDFRTKFSRTEQTQGYGQDLDTRTGRDDSSLTLEDNQLLTGLDESPQHGEGNLDSTHPAKGQPRSSVDINRTETGDSRQSYPSPVASFEDQSRSTKAKKSAGVNQAAPHVDGISNFDLAQVDGSHETAPLKPKSRVPSKSKAKSGLSQIIGKTTYRNQSFTQ